MKQVYCCFSTDFLQVGHMNIIRTAAELGELTIGVLADEVIATYKRYPLIPLEERVAMLSNIKGVSRVVIQDTLSYKKVLEELKPDIVVHGDDWVTGYQSKIRAEVVNILKSYGGELIETPYTQSQTNEVFSKLEQILSMPENRRSRLKKLLGYKKCLSVMEAHNGLTGLIVENARIETTSGVKQFDAMWVSSLCDSTIKGKPDIELVDMTSRLKTIEEIMEVTTKPIILDGDTGGLTEHFVFNIKTLERIGVSAIIIEDKKGLKKNSLFGDDAGQVQEDIPSFCEKIKAGKNALHTKDFMIIARCESLVLKQGMEDALERCFSYVEAGVDGIMIHSASKTPDEVLTFCKRFREKEPTIPIIVVPTTYNTVTEEELSEVGVNVVIHANHLIRAAFPAMKKTAEMILENSRSLEASENCLSIKEIITLIPDC